MIDHKILMITKSDRSLIILLELTIYDNSSYNIINNEISIQQYDELVFESKSDCWEVSRSNHN